MGTAKNADKQVSEDWKKDKGIYTPPKVEEICVVKAEFKLKIKGFVIEKKQNE